MRQFDIKRTPSAVNVLIYFNCLKIRGHVEGINATCHKRIHQRTRTRDSFIGMLPKKVK